MSTRKRVNGSKRHGQPAKAQSAAGLAEFARATGRLWRKHHLSYDQSKYVVERARRALAPEPPRTRRRTIQRLDLAEVERLIRSAYRDRSAYGVMIKTLFLTGARVDEFVRIRARTSTWTRSRPTSTWRTPSDRPAGTCPCCPRWRRNCALT